ncbi:WD40-repeat-containing domain protein [Diaporthe sp. PMI_573]|nr:WD40-repeat-containing domain protein [Diaporthaceae sp. PMI_573]
MAHHPNNEAEESYDWSHILVPGELKSNPREDNHSSTWLDLKGILLVCCELVSTTLCSADGQRLASGSGDNTVKVWDAATGAYMQTLEGHGLPVTSAAFSADGQRLASGSHDKTVKVWDVATGACAQTLEIDRVITHLSFDPMTNSLLSTDIGLLNLDLPALPPAIDNQSTDATLRGDRHSGWGISTDGLWIVKDGKGMLWLPPECRASKSAVVGSTVAIGCRSGRVLVMKFS